MTTNSPHSDQLPAAEQASNGVVSGLLTLELANLITDAANAWSEKDTLPISLLLALTNLSVKQPVQAKEGFTPWDIAEAMSVVRGIKWAVDDDREKVSDKVRVNWKKLTEALWKTKHEGLCQRASDLGLTEVPELHRTAGGGTGRPTRYKIIAIPLANDEPAWMPEPLILERGEIRYISEDMKDPGLFIRIFSSGFEISGWRRWVYLLTLAASLLIALALALFISAGMIVQIPLKNLVYSFLGAGTLLFAMWITLGPIFRLSYSKILLAPWWMQSVEDDRLLEWRCPPRHSVKTIRAARYSGVCSLCGGKVAIRSGGWEFFGRLLGRCEESPQEHVFTFDHVLRLGRPVSRT